MLSGDVAYYLLPDHFNSMAYIVNSAETIHTTTYNFGFGGRQGGALAP